jgi:hypothetical protein
MDQPPAPAYTVGQRLRSRSPYHAGEVGTVIRRHSTRPWAGYVVEFAGAPSGEGAPARPPLARAG